MKPPGSNAITSELTGILTRTDMEVTDIVLQVIDAMRNDNSFGKSIEIMVEGMQFFS